MGRVAREMVEQAGLDVNVLLDKLIAAASADFTAFYYFTILRVNAIGLEGEGLKGIIEDARIEHRDSFEVLVPRIYELGGRLPDDIRTVADVAGCPDAYLPESLGASLTGQQSTYDLLTVLVEAERCGIRVYNDICNYTAGKDHRTYDLAQAALHARVKRESWFSEFLGEGPSGHLRPPP